MKLSEKTDQLFAALAKVKKELGPVKKGAFNPHFKSTFADLNTHIETIEPVLEANGLMLLQPTSGNADGSNSVISLLVHTESGQWIQSSLQLINVQDMQKTLAGITYARRGMMNFLFNLASADDDGEILVGRGSYKAKSEPKAAPKVEAKPAAKSGGFKKPETKTETKTAPVKDTPAAGGWN